MLKTISFKVSDKLYNSIKSLADYNKAGISNYTKKLISKSIKKELGRITENQMTVADEIEILHSAKYGKSYGPFNTADEAIKFLSRAK